MKSLITLFFLRTGVHQVAFAEGAGRTVKTFDYETAKMKIQ